jgi:hypothetical protein
MYSFTRCVNGDPARKNAKGQQERGQQHERHGDAVDAHMEADRTEPGPELDELELRRFGIEIAPQQERQREGDKRGPQRDIARIAEGALVLPAEEPDQKRAEQRQEGDGGEDRPAIAHGLSPPLAKMK